MTTETTRRALFGGAGIVALAAAAPALSGAVPPPTKLLNRRDWDAAFAKLQAELARDRALDARHSEAQANGTLTEELEQEWSDSIDPLCVAEWELFATTAPDLAALDWKLKHLADHGLIDEDNVEQLRADIKRLFSMEGR